MDRQEVATEEHVANARFTIQKRPERVGGNALFSAKRHLTSEKERCME